MRVLRKTGERIVFVRERKNWERYVNLKKEIQISFPKMNCLGKLKQRIINISIVLSWSC